jgi:hypothetical protein
MSLLRKGFLPITLGLILAPVAWAGDDDKKADGKKGDEMTIRGVVSEVTLLGETDVDFKTGKAITAESTFLTIIGHPYDAAMHKDKEGYQANADKKDANIKRTSNDSSKSAGRSRHRMNVYVVAVTPRTKFCECTEPGKDGAAAKEEACNMDELEIGDHVEVCFDPKDTSRADRDGGKDAKSANMKHGRHRTYFGTATAVKIMDMPMEGTHDESKEKSGKK